MIFPHANGQEIDDIEFVKLWSLWFAGPNSKGILNANDPIPRLPRQVVFDELEAQGCGHGLDAFCRSIVRKTFKNTKQASLSFLEDNSKILKPVEAVNPVTGRRVRGVQLTEYGLKLLRQVS